MVTEETKAEFRAFYRREATYWWSLAASAGHDAYCIEYGTLPECRNGTRWPLGPALSKTLDKVRRERRACIKVARAYQYLGTL